MFTAASEGSPVFLLLCVCVLLFCYGARKERKGENEHNIHLSSFWEDTAAAAAANKQQHKIRIPISPAGSFFFFFPTVFTHDTYNTLD
jgi:hypothetical protein